MRKVRLLIFVAAALTALYAMAVAVAYRWPPVLIRGFTHLPDPNQVVVMADLVVQAPVSLREVSVTSGDAPAVEEAPAGSGARTLRLAWAPGATLPEAVTIRYRFLGWPFQTSHAVTWQPAQAATAALEPDTALAKLCRGENPELSEAALQELNAAVAGASGDDPLQARLAALVPDWAEPVALHADADGDGRPDSLIALGGCQLPVLVYRAAAPGQAVLLPATEQFYGRPLGGARIDQVADVNGDGKPELVMEQRTAGGSADNAFMYIYQWDGEVFTPLFTDHLSNWRGPNQWTVGNGTVTIQCRPLGPFEHKLSPSRQQTEKFRWNPATSQYELTDRTREPVQTQAQQLSDAEELFQGGSYDDALLAYSQVGRFRADASGDAPQVDWPSLAAYRIGQIHALAGRRAQAQAALDGAATGAYPVGPLAVQFRTAYTRGEAADGFAAAWAFIEQSWGKADWPSLLDKPTLGARRAMLEAFAAAGRQAPANLPDPAPYPPPLCLSIAH